MTPKRRCVHASPSFGPRRGRLHGKKRRNNDETKGKEEKKRKEKEASSPFRRSVERRGKREREKERARARVRECTRSIFCGSLAESSRA